MPDREEFEQEDYAQTRPFDASDEVFACSFERCDFTESDLGGVAFVDCTFKGCNLSMADLDGVRLQDTSFENCKLVGLDFGKCSEFAFSVDFKGCNLDFASFEDLHLQETDFSGCSLKQANFAEADLSEANLADCDLSGAIFARTNLESTDLRGARNLAIDPELNRLAKAKISRSSLDGLLHKYELEIE